MSTYSESSASTDPDQEESQLEGIQRAEPERIRHDQAMPQEQQDQECPPPPKLNWCMKSKKPYVLFEEKQQDEQGITAVVHMPFFALRPPGMKDEFECRVFDEEEFVILPEKPGYSDWQGGSGTYFRLGSIPSMGFWEIVWNSPEDYERDQRVEEGKTGTVIYDSRSGWDDGLLSLLEGFLPPYSARATSHFATEPPPKVTRDGQDIVEFIWELSRKEEQEEGKRRRKGKKRKRGEEEGDEEEEEGGGGPNREKMDLPFKFRRKEFFS
ncbi:hypothetical protein F4780DRAFT_797276 [Xylariomycetidae sp. FL0641]|nr:hypothetical protein F4780DRAFT_797276 [Xylariomycetidae sp. FL0641]